MTTHDLFVKTGYDYCTMLVNKGISYQVDDNNFEYQIDLKELEILCKTRNSLRKCFEYQEVIMNQQSKIEQLENRVLELENIITYVAEELEYPTAPYDEVIRCSIKSLKGGLNEDQD